MRRLMSSAVALTVISLGTLAQAQMHRPNLPASYNPLNCDELNTGLCPELPCGIERGKSRF